MMIKNEIKKTLLVLDVYIFLVVTSDYDFMVLLKVNII